MIRAICILSCGGILWGMLPGCVAMAPGPQSAVARESFGGEAMKPGGGSPPSTYLASFSQDDAATADADEAPERLVVYNAALEILVAQIDAARAAFVARVEAQGGYLQKRERETVTCRVP